jgi:hypothetical protein
MREREREKDYVCVCVCVYVCTCVQIAVKINKTCRGLKQPCFKCRNERKDLSDMRKFSHHFSSRYFSVSH